MHLGPITEFLIWRRKLQFSFCLLVPLNRPQVLHCFPLAVVQAGAYILKRGALRRYLALYEQNQARLLSEVPAQSHDKYAWPVYTTWDISFKCLRKLATRFLQLCSFLHHEGISEAICSKAAIYTPYILGPTLEQVKDPQEFLSQFCTSAGMWDTLSFADMASELQEYSLINQDPNTSLFSIHPLVHGWSRNTVSDLDATRGCTAALLAMLVTWEDQVFTMRLLPHINTVLQVDSQLSTEFLYPYQQIYYQGNFQRAQELCEELLEKAKSTLGVEHLMTLRVMANLADTHRSLGRWTDAAALGVVILEKMTKVLGAEHPDTLTAMGDLGNNYRDLGKLTDAEELEVVVLEKRKKLLPEHPDTLTAIANLGATYLSLGKLTDAEELEVVVLEKSKKLLGPEHPDTLTAMANLGATYRGLGKLTDAEELEVVALEKRKKLLGPEHPDTLTAMANLGATYQGFGKLTDAEELEEVVLEKSRQTLGPEHPDTLDAMDNLAETHCDLGKFREAEQLLQIVVEGRTWLLGTTHPHTVSAQKGLLHCKNLAENTASK
ncbi:hypothetical protein C8J57DRAFT_1637846 [Mycena rebaudengoi]|nr:hypothetical protein C8J57DRAFT_1637846 [Mycena rebaudengoi]